MVKTILVIVAIYLLWDYTLTSSVKQGYLAGCEDTVLRHKQLTQSDNMDLFCKQRYEIIFK